MSHWKRIRLTALVTTLALTGLVAACSHGGRTEPASERDGPARHGRHEARPGEPMPDLFGMPGPHPHHGAMSEADETRQREQFIARLSQDLSLNPAQQTRLGALADALSAQRKAMQTAAGHTQNDVLKLVAGTKFDRAAAQAQMDARAAAHQASGPAVMTAAADFYDSLQTEQQAKVRAFLARRDGPGEKKRYAPIPR